LKIKLILGVILSVFYLSTAPSIPHATVQAKLAQVPSYAKWGRLAIKETQKKYPMAQITDYQHVYRETKKNGTTIEHFKLWLKEPNREFGVNIMITFDTKTEEVKKIVLLETQS